MAENSSSDNVVSLENFRQKKISQVQDYLRQKKCERMKTLNRFLLKETMRQNNEYVKKLLGDAKKITQKLETEQDTENS